MNRASGVPSINRKPADEYSTWGIYRREAIDARALDVSPGNTMRQIDFSLLAFGYWLLAIGYWLSKVGLITGN